MIQVVNPGLFTTVQDLGRPGFGLQGVSPSGAADPVSLLIGNRLVSNPDNAAALEMTLLGATLTFTQPTAIALAGSDFNATLDAAPLPPFTTRTVSPGQTLRCGPTRSGARAYLCIHGGIAVPEFLGSASTHILSGLGGFQGRALRKGDTLSIGPPRAPFQPRTLNPRAAALFAPRKQLRVTRSTQWDWFPNPAQRLFETGPYLVTEESNRMGLRLQGLPLQPSVPTEMITEGVPLGAIQIPASGQPIILFVEQQTTGGYPKIANIVTADLPSVGQLRPRDEIRFELVSPETARALLLETEALLRSEDLFTPLP